MSIYVVVSPCQPLQVAFSRRGCCASLGHLFESASVLHCECVPTPKRKKGLRLFDSIANSSKKVLETSYDMFCIFLDCVNPREESSLCPASADMNGSKTALFLKNDFRET